MIILSVDYGDTRTGIAVCDKTEFLASPVTVITEKESEPLIEKITEIAKEKKAELIVVGLPSIWTAPTANALIAARISRRL